MTDQNELIPLLPGDILRHHRQKKGLSLAQAAERSRIKVSVLAAIEDGETSAIPSVYLRGYMRNYARFLGADLVELEAHISRVRGAEPVVQTIFEVDRRRGFTEKWLKFASYVAASALIGTLAWQFTHEAVRFSQGDGQRMSSADPNQDGAVGSLATPTIPPRSANTHLNASIASIEVLNQGRDPVVPPLAEAAWAAIDAHPEDGTQGNEALSDGSHSLAISTSADTWVEIIDSDDAQLEMDLLRGGSLREYSGNPPFRVMIGRASAVELKMDEKLVDLGPHTRGNVARLTLDADRLIEAAPQANAETH
ncbi:MAG: DUF4115 domain-containing protein [Xanthomonadales bacterium]|nr:DUF4115 domain-containing protein [Xanthomonadales bacterium]